MHPSPPQDSKAYKPKMRAEDPPSPLGDSPAAATAIAAPALKPKFRRRVEPEYNVFDRSVPEGTAKYTYR